MSKKKIIDAVLLVLSMLLMLTELVQEMEKVSEPYDGTE